MSVHVLSWTLKHSEARLGARLVLIVLADHAHHDGSEAYPSVGLIAREARMSPRNVRYALRQLEASGAVEHTRDKLIESGVVRVYRVVMDPPAETAPRQDPTTNVSDFAPEPSLNRPNPSLSSNVVERRGKGELSKLDRERVPA